jgi:hypothetical protein
MPFTEVTRHSLGSRLRKSLGGVIVGILIIIAAITTLWWNEGRAVKTARGLDEGLGQVVSAHSENILSENDGKLVHIIGTISSEEELQDPEFGISQRALKLKRSVEVFQWVEKKDRESEKKVGGSEEVTTTYTYEQAWHSRPIASHKFKETAGHENPAAFPYSSFTLSTGQGRLGSYSVPKWMMDRIGGYEVVRLEGLEDRFSDRIIDMDSSPRSAVFIGNGTISEPRVGDTRIQWFQAPSGSFSVIAKQFGNSLEPFHTSFGTTIDMLTRGEVSADSMFRSAHRSNTLLTWVLRVLGFFLIAIGFRIIMKPLIVLGDIIPLIGRIVSVLVNMVSALFSLMISFIVIGLAWVWYRPWLGGSMLLLAVVIFVLYRKRARTSVSVVPEVD